MFMLYVVKFYSTIYNSISCLQMQQKLTSINSSSKKIRQSSNLMSKENNFLIKQRLFKQENMANIEQKSKMESLLAFSKQPKTMLSKRRLRNHFDVSVKLSQLFQKDWSLNSSNFGKSKLKNQTRDENRSNKSLLNILLSQVSASPKQEMKTLKQIQNQFLSQEQQKMNNLFADVLKVKKCKQYQNQNVIFKRNESQESIFRKKHMVHHSHKLTHTFKKPRNNLMKSEFSLGYIKNYPFSGIRLLDKSVQLRNMQSQNMNRMIYDSKFKRQKLQLLRIKQKQHKNHREGIYMEPWATKDDRLQIQTDQFI